MVSKLVRERIPQLTAANGQPCDSHVAGQAEYGPRLAAMLVEEAHEAAHGVYQAGVVVDSAMSRLNPLMSLLGIAHRSIVRGIARHRLVGRLSDGPLVTLPAFSCSLADAKDIANDSGDEREHRRQDEQLAEIFDLLQPTCPQVLPGSYAVCRCRICGQQCRDAAQARIGLPSVDAKCSEQQCCQDQQPFEDPVAQVRHVALPLWEGEKLPNSRRLVVGRWSGASWCSRDLLNSGPRNLGQGTQSLEICKNLSDVGTLWVLTKCLSPPLNNRSLKVHGKAPTRDGGKHKQVKPPHQQHRQRHQNHRDQVRNDQTQSHRAYLLESSPRSKSGSYSTCAANGTCRAARHVGFAGDAVTPPTISDLVGRVVETPA